jgi:hypothetical protein
MQYFLLGFFLLAALLFLGRWFVEADPRRVALGLKWGGLSVAAFILLFILASGRVALLFALVPAAFWIYRMIQRGKAARGPSAGQASEVRTRFLQMRLDHDSGALDGEILDGRYEGQVLSRLDLAALLELLQDYRIADAQSASVLEAYLDRTQPDWRASEEEAEAEAKSAGSGAHEGSTRGDGSRWGRGPRPPGAMSRAEALEILGLEEGAGAEAIREAHRRLMQKLHPDHGGSNYLAAKLNEAKDLLLRH